jgi:probable rRNA maturation factor
MSVRLSGPPEPIRPRHLDVPLQKRRGRLILSGLGHSRSELSIALVGDAEIAELNEGYRQKSRPTDVLSFSLLEGPHADFRGQLLGDVVISVETAARQARARRRSLDEEVSRLLIHGVLHLIGHDHEATDEARIMRAEERRLWAAVRA